MEVEKYGWSNYEVNVYDHGGEEWSAFGKSPTTFGKDIGSEIMGTENKGVKSAARDALRSHPD